MYILYKSFEELIYFKPSLNPSSSEIYIICLNFKGNMYRDILMTYYNKFNINTWMFDSFDENFLIKHTDAIVSLVNHVKSSIYRSIILYYYYTDKHYKKLQSCQIKYNKSWINKYL